MRKREGEGGRKERENEGQNKLHTQKKKKVIRIEEKKEKEIKELIKKIHKNKKIENCNRRNTHAEEPETKTGKQVREKMKEGKK